jgi:hypothetical protein
MIGVAKTSDDDERNDWGMPTVAAEAPDNRGNFHQHVELNKALPWVAFSWFLSGGAIIGLILIALLLPTLIDAKVEKAAAQIMQETAQQVAAATEQANSARTFGRLANEKSDRVLAQLEARGLVKQENH